VTGNILHCHYSQDRCSWDRCFEGRWRKCRCGTPAPGRCRCDMRDNIDLGDVQGWHTVGASTPASHRRCHLT